MSKAPPVYSYKCPDYHMRMGAFMVRREDTEDLVAVFPYSTDEERASAEATCELFMAAWRDGYSSR